VLHDVFGIATTYQGKVEQDGEPQLVVAQPYIVEAADDPATDGDATAFMQAHGFSRVDSCDIVNPEIKDVTWYRQRDGLLITDAHARNFRKDYNGVIIPIDLIVTTLPAGTTKLLPPPHGVWTPQF
jgi:hypothetical protein